MVHNSFAVIDLVQLWSTWEKLITLATKYKSTAYHTKTERQKHSLLKPSRLNHTYTRIIFHAPDYCCCK